MKEIVKHLEKLEKESLDLIEKIYNEWKKAEFGSARQHRLMKIRIKAHKRYERREREAYKAFKKKMWEDAEKDNHKHQSSLLSLEELVNPEEIKERKRMLEIQRAKLDKAEERFLDKAKRMFEMDVEMAESNWI